MIYLVTWDLNKEGLAYTHARANLIAAIDKFTNNNHPNLRSVRFVSTTRTADELYDFLFKEGKLDSNDTMVVTKMERHTDLSQGNLGKTLWDWILARV